MRTLSSQRADVALDLGTATTRLRVAPRLAPLSRPSAVWRRGGERRALAGGVVVDVDAASAVVADLLHGVRGRWRRPNVLACVPTDATETEREALRDAVQRAGAGGVRVAPEPLAAAVGAGLEIDGPRARAIVDIGEGVTDCAIVQGGQLVASAALRVGVADLRGALQRWLAQTLDVRVADGEAERILRELGVAPRRDRPRVLVVTGRPASGFGPVLERVEPEDLIEAIEPVADRIAEHVGRFVSSAPDELQGDLQDAGICLTGGGALLHGMPERLVGELRVAVARVANPLDAVIEGAHRIGTMR